MRILIRVKGKIVEVEGTYDPGQPLTRDQEFIPASFEVEDVFKDGVALEDPWGEIVIDYIQKNHEQDCIDAYLNASEEIELERQLSLREVA